MGLKIFAVIIILFLAEIVFLTTKEFKESKPSKEVIDFTDIAFENIQAFRYTSEGTEAVVHASRVLKYSQKALFFDLDLAFFNPENTHRMRSDSATLEGDMAHLIGNVQYENNASMQVKSQDLVYNTKTKLLTCDVPFTLHAPDMDVMGERFAYNSLEGTLNVEKIIYVGKNSEEQP